MRMRRLAPYGLSLLSIAGVHAAVADPCAQPVGDPPADFEVLIGDPDCSPSDWPDCRDAIASRDGKVLRIQGNHGGWGQDPLEPWDVKVAFDVPVVPGAGLHLSIDLLRLEPNNGVDDYTWYDEAVLVCTGEDVMDWPTLTSCLPSEADSHLVLSFHFSQIPDRCIGSNGAGSETVRVVWRGKMIGDHISGADDRQVDRLGIDP